MIMMPELRNFPETFFSGIRKEMSYAHNTTFELWHKFMPQRPSIHNVTGTDLFSIEVYPDGFFKAFNPANTFEKWAAVPVFSKDVGDGMELLVIPDGLYVVFTHHGPASEGAETYRRIFEDWLPASGFVLDNRPHFAVMGEKYKADCPSSEEEIWIPVKQS